MKIYSKKINLIKGTIEEVLREHVQHAAIKKRIIDFWIDHEKKQSFKKIVTVTQGVLYSSNSLFFKWLELR